MKREPRFTAVSAGTYYYPAFAIASQRGVLCSEVFWRKRDAVAELRDNAADYLMSDRVVRVDVIALRRREA